MQNFRYSPIAIDIQMRKQIYLYFYLNKTH